MSITNSASCDTTRRPAPLAAVAARPAADPAGPLRTRVYSLPANCRSRASRASAQSRHRRDSAAGSQVREEEGEYEIPDLLKDRSYEPDPALCDAAHAHTEAQREAMALLDDAENLLAVVVAAIEDDGDSRAMQAEAVLRVAKKKLSKAHTRIDRQEARHRNLFLAYFELQARSGEELE